LQWIQEALGSEAEVVFDEELYGIKADALIRKLEGFPNTKSTILVVGHNPAISDAMRTLLNLVENSDVSVTLPAKPSQLAIFRVRTTDWAALTTGKVELETSFEPDL
jgi:phosphohistidine phosphatase SixA